jgi:hypothetical protein
MPKHGPEGAVDDVVGLLANGLTGEQLCRCADGFAAKCRADDTAPKYRMKARNFYGKAAGYKEYLDYQPSIDAPGDGQDNYAARVQAEREERERRRARAAQSPSIKEINPGERREEDQ